jgi:hypothetical protein
MLDFIRFVAPPISPSTEISSRTIVASRPSGRLTDAFTRRGTMVTSIRDTAGSAAGLWDVEAQIARYLVAEHVIRLDAAEG